MKPQRRLFPFLLTALILFWAATAHKAAGQGSFRPGISWKMASTSSARIIYPAGLESQALRVAGNLSEIAARQRPGIGPVTEKIDLVLNNFGVESNGYVTVMPFRSEFYTNPMQDAASLGSMPWLDLLSLHEYRHALQFANLRQGYVSLAWLFFGEAGWGAMMNILTPGWYFEGDAVLAETLLSGQGRGRIPAFLQQTRNILLSRKPYSYMKAVNGSYRDRVPNEYELGYLLCSYGYDRFGPDLWPKVINGTTDLKGIAYPFSSSLQALTGLTTRKFYRAAMEEFGNEWSAKLSQTEPTGYDTVSRPDRTVTDYRFPRTDPAGSILAYRRSYRETGGIYEIGADGLERRLCELGMVSDARFSAGGNLIAWAEERLHPRWSAESWSDVVLFDRSTGNTRFLTRRGRYFAPELSADGRSLVAVESDPLGNTRLVILDVLDGSVSRALPYPSDSIYLAYPRWDPASPSIVCTARTLQGTMLLVSQDTETGAFSRLTPEFTQVIGNADVHTDRILFSAGTGGTQNICSLDRRSGRIEGLTRSRAGAYDPVLDERSGRLWWSESVKDGYQLASAAAGSLVPYETGPERPAAASPLPFSHLGEPRRILPAALREEVKTGPYAGIPRLPKIHSWFLEPGLYATGIRLMADDVLGKVSVEGAIAYHYAEMAPGVEATIRYSGLYPVISASAGSSYRHPTVADLFSEDSVFNPVSLDSHYSFGLALPLNLSRGRWFRNLDLSLGYRHINSIDLTPTGPEARGDVRVGAVTGSFRYGAFRKSAYQNLTTPLGAALEVSASQSVLFTKAWQYQAIADFAARGLFLNHNITLSAGLRYEAAGSSYRFTDNFIHPRGYLPDRTDIAAILQTGYHFPLLYPDIGAAGIAYLLRIRGALFADFGWGYSASGSGRFATSAGAELMFDISWFNLAEFPVGIRWSYLMVPDPADPERTYKFEFFIPVFRL